MSQAPDDPILNDSDPDESALVYLRRYRSILRRRHADHTSGKLALPPEQSLALRSNITRLSEMIEPGSRQMWPEYSSAEKALLALQTDKRQSAANDISIAFLGPLAAPAIAAKGLGAPSGTVSQFMGLVFNLLAVVGLSRVGLRSVSPAGVVEPIKPVSRDPARETHPPAIAAASHETNGTPADNFMRDAVAQIDYAKPALDWIRQAQESGQLNAPKLSVLVEHYSGKEGLRASERGGQTIEQWSQRFTGNVVGESSDGAMQTANRFAVDFIKSTTTEGMVDATKLLEVLKAMEEGLYATPADYAALQLVRGEAEYNYTRQSIRDALDIALSSGIEDKHILKMIEDQTRANVEQTNPYRSPLENEKQPPSPDHGSER